MPVPRQGSLSDPTPEKPSTVFDAAPGKDSDFIGWPSPKRFSSRRRRLLHSVVHSFFFSPSPVAVATASFLAVIKQNFEELDCLAKDENVETVQEFSMDAVGCGQECRNALLTVEAEWS